MAIGNAVNWGEWLRRLGLKSIAEPELLNEIEPAVLAGDWSHLVSPVWRSRGVAGGYAAGSLTGAGVWTVRTSVPLIVRAVLSMDAGSGAIYQRSGPVNTMPVYAVTPSPPTDLPPLVSAGPVSSLWSRFLVDPANPTDFTVPVSQTTRASVVMPDVFVPAGHFWAWEGAFAGSPQGAVYGLFHFQELPTEREG